MIKHVRVWECASPCGVFGATGGIAYTVQKIGTQTIFASGSTPDPVPLHLIRRPCFWSRDPTLTYHSSSHININFGDHLEALDH